MHSSGTMGWSCPVAGWSKAPGPGFTSFCRQVFFAVLCLNRVNTPRKQRWGMYFEAQQKVASGFNALAAEVLVGHRGTSHRSEKPALKPNLVRCSALPPAMANEHLSSAGLHRSLGSIAWLLWETSFPSVFNLLTDMLLPGSGLVSKSVCITSFAPGENHLPRSSVVYVAGHSTHVLS